LFWGEFHLEQATGIETIQQMKEDKLSVDTMTSSEIALHSGLSNCGLRPQGVTDFSSDLKNSCIHSQFWKISKQNLIYSWVLLDYAAAGGETFRKCFHDCTRTFYKQVIVRVERL
jgi:hypothetical protein